jgi:hypothetical protein
MTDIITTIIKEFQSRTDIPLEIACAIEKDIRQRWGGGTAYIGKTCTTRNLSIAKTTTRYPLTMRKPVGRATASSLPDNHPEMSGAKSRARPTQLRVFVVNK